MICWQLFVVRTGREWVERGGADRRPPTGPWLPGWLGVFSLRSLIFPDKLCCSLCCRQRTQSRFRAQHLSKNNLIFYFMFIFEIWRDTQGTYNDNLSGRPRPTRQFQSISDRLNPVQSSPVQQPGLRRRRSVLVHQRYSLGNGWTGLD